MKISMNLKLHWFPYCRTSTNCTNIDQNILINENEKLAEAAILIADPFLSSKGKIQ